MLTPKIQTSNLTLRRYQENDIDAIYEIITDPRLAKYIKFPTLTKEEELQNIKKWIKEADESEKEKWVIERKSDRAVVGNIEVASVTKKHNYCNVGYTIRYDYWGNGYATEALKAGFKKDGYIANRRLNLDGTYSGVEYYSKSKN